MLMRIWLHGKIDQEPSTISQRADGTWIIIGGVFRYRRWQGLLNRLMPRTFPLFGWHHDLETGEDRICGLTPQQICDRCADRTYGPGDECDPED